MHTTLLNEVGVKGITVWWGLNYFAVHQNAFERNNLVYFPTNRNLVHFFQRLAPAALNCICVEWFVCNLVPRVRTRLVCLYVCVSSNWLVVVWVDQNLKRYAASKFVSTQSSNTWLLVSILERFSNDCRKSKTKAITPTNHNRTKQRDEPITIICNSLKAREESRARRSKPFTLCLCIKTICAMQKKMHFAYFVRDQLGIIAKHLI